ncbi:MAG: ATP-grasp domain-containing protein [Nocardioidaceae bacterium]
MTERPPGRPGEAPVYLVTSADQPELGADDQLLHRELTAAGVPSQIAIWTDPEVDWAAASVCVLRSVWDYHLEPARFHSWLYQLEPVATVLNPPALVRWNAHKGYLRKLAAAGVPTIETAWLGHGEPADLTEVMRARGWNAAIVKPAVSASAWKTAKVELGDPEGQHLVDDLIGHTDVMVQPWLDTIERDGEVAVIAIGGEVTHAAGRASALTGGIESTRHGWPHRLCPDEHALASFVLSLLPTTPLYARVDLVRDEHGRLLLGELELIEPVLYLHHSRPALERLVAALAPGGTTRA